MRGSLSSWVVLLVKILWLNQCLTVVTGTELHPHTGFMWQGFGSMYVCVCVYACGYVSVSRAKQLPDVRSEPASAGSKKTCRWTELSQGVMMVGPWEGRLKKWGKKPATQQQLGKKGKKETTTSTSYLLHTSPSVQRKLFFCNQTLASAKIG